MMDAWSTSAAASSPNTSHHQGGAGHHPFHSWGPELSSSPSGSSPQHSGLFIRRSSASRGSMRKMLPQTPDMDTQASLSAKMIDRRTSTPRGYHSYGPFFLEYSLLAEFNLLQRQRLPGVYVIPAANTPLKWFGVIFVRSGVFQGGVFRIKIVIPENYPDGDCPRIFLDEPLFHPNVDPQTNELDLSKGFHKWKRNVNHIYQVLQYARRLLYKLDVRDPVNQEAATLYESDRSAFADRVRQDMNESENRMCSDGEASPPDSTDPDSSDPHYIIFSTFREGTHDSLIKDAIKDLSNPSKTANTSGLSFMEKGSLDIFSAAKNNTNNNKANS